jgi:hypothetical protein
LLKLIDTACVIGIVLVTYARWVEPYWIEVTYHAIAAPVAAPLKLAHLSDVHTLGMGRRERAVLRILEREKPDAIVVTGDTLSNDATFDQMQLFLRQLNAPLGVWVVRGNWEAFSAGKSGGAIYANTGVNLLLNGNARLRADVWIAGADEASMGRPDYEATFRGIPEGAYVIALFHAPVALESVAGRAPLALAGHTHGGQVCLPFYGPVWLPPGAEGFWKGWYERGGTRMYISRGVGTSILHYRFLSRPEVAFHTLAPVGPKPAGASGLTSEDGARTFENRNVKAALTPAGASNR